MVTINQTREWKAKYPYIEKYINGLRGAIDNKQIFEVFNTAQIVRKILNGNIAYG